MVIGTKEVTLCGIAKGAGMIEPNMATMLAFVMTDADIGHDSLDALFRRAVDGSFNAVTVDGCMSTNDTALILANGVAGNPPIKRGSRYLGRFGEALSSLLAELARGLVRDGEGATKLIEITVEEAKTIRDARRIAYAVANSNLVKTAFFGGDPNWGRIISAAGSVGIDLPVDRVTSFFRGCSPVFPRKRRSGPAGGSERDHETGPRYAFAWDWAWDRDPGRYAHPIFPLITSRSTPITIPDEIGRRFFITLFSA